MKNILVSIILLISMSGFSQESISELLNKLNDASIPYITVQELAMPKTEALLLDTRELKEYETSHIKNAVFVGYNTFSADSITNTYQDKQQKIVVYCSLGVRSEKIALKLKKVGYTNVYNLYGGIFEWKNNSFPVFNSSGIETENVHVYNQYWSKWLTHGNKVF